ncbi:MAG: hypothetical protein ABIF08_02645 [Nanoarchaeota archaeon]
MKPPCEIIVKEFLPNFRAMVAKRLMDDFGFTQKKSADMMGITQPAISQYMKGVRGLTDNYDNNPRIAALIHAIAEKVASGNHNQYDVTLEFCDFCRALRQDGAFCEAHKAMYTTLHDCEKCTK